MTNAPLTKILLPAVMVSSATFTALNAPFFLLSSEPLVIDVPPLFSAQIQPVFLQEHRDFAIRYVGGSIVVSVAAGLITAELLRNRYRRAARGERPTRELLEQILREAESRPVEPVLENSYALNSPFEGMDLELSETVGEELFISGDWVDESSPDPYRSNSPGAFRELEDGLPLMVLENPLENRELEYEAIALEKTLIESPVSREVEPVLELSAEIPIERIQLPDQQQTYPALLIEGQYYRLLRAGKSSQQAQRIATRLRHEGRQVLLTQTDSLRGTTIWILEPQACLANPHPLNHDAD